MSLHNNFPSNCVYLKIKGEGNHFKLEKVFFHETHTRSKTNSDGSTSTESYTVRYDSDKTVFK
jgi:hypothetical protein